MALNPLVNFPGKVDAASAAYPYGTARDVVTSGDGTGTPWDAELIGDMWGLFQGLLSRAGINPSGVGDTVTVSQYIEALNKICGRATATTLDIIAAGSDFTRTGVLTTSGYAAAGDGGGCVWVGTGNVGTPSTTDFSNGLIYDAQGNEFRVFGRFRNPRQFGAVGDGVADDAQAIEDCIGSLASTGGVVYLDGGTYKCTRELALDDKIILRGESREAVTLDFTGASGAAFPSGFCVFAFGAMAALPDLSTSVTLGSTALAFTGVHGLAVDDVIAVLDPTNFSLSAAQSYYRAGEFIRIATVPSTSTATAGRATFGAYVAATVDMGKLAPKRVEVEGLTIRGLGTTDAVGCVGLRYCRDSVVRRVAVSGSQANGLVAVERCYGVEVEHVDGWDFNAAAATVRHAVGVHNSQRVRVSGCRGSTGRAFLRTGGLDVAWAVPCRDVLVSDCYADDTMIYDLSMEIGGDTEYWRVTNCTLGGLVVGGDRGSVDGCTIYGAGGSGGGPVSTIGGAVALSEAHGMSFAFRGCDFVATRDVGTGTALVYLVDSTVALVVPGVVMFAGCRFDLAGFAGAGFIASSWSAAASQSLELVGCKAIGGGTFTINSAAAATYWEHVGVRSCDFVGAGVLVQGAEAVDFVGCRSVDAPADGFAVKGLASAPYAAQRVNVQGCSVRGAAFAGIRVGDTTAATLVSAVIASCVSLANNASGTVGATGNTYASLRLETCSSVVLTGNVVGDDGGAPTQLKSYSVESITSLTAIDTVTLGALDRSAATITADHYVGERRVGTDDEYATGKQYIAGGTPALAGTGADDLVIGDGTGNRGITVRAAASGVSRLAFGDAASADMFRVQGDHTARRLDLYANGGRHVRMLADAVELGRIYGDPSQPADGGDFTTPSWDGAPEFTAGGSECAAWFEVVNASPAANFQLDYEFPNGAYDEPPIVVVEIVGDGNRELMRVSGVTTTVATVVQYGAGLPAGTTRFNFIVIGTRT